jgi:hypothetical protein
MPVSETGQRRDQLDRRVVAVGGHAVLPGALGQLGDLGEHRLARALADEVGERVERVDLELVHHLQQPLGADVVAGREAVDVADGVDRQARVGADHRHQRLVHLAALGELEHRDEQALHEHVGRVGPEADAADVHEMAGAAEQRDQLALAEDRRGDDEVVGVAGALPRIVGDVDVAVFHRRRREMGDEVLHRFRHRVHVAGRAGHRLGEHAPVEIEDAGGEVARLAHDRREGRAHQRLRLLLDDRDQAVPHDLQPDLVET